MFEFTAADWHSKWHRRARSQESVNCPDCSGATQISHRIQQIIFSMRNHFKCKQI